MRFFASCLVPAVLQLAGCSSWSSDSTPAPDQVERTSAATPEEGHASGRRARPLPPVRIVGPYAASQLIDVALVRHGRRFDVVTSWSSTRPGHEGERAMLLTDDGGSRAVRWTQRRALDLLASFTARDRSAEAALSPLLVATATSLAPGIRAVVAARRPSPRPTTGCG